MTIEVELPDGRVLEFPDGTTPEQMRAAISRLGLTGPAQPSPVMEAVDTAGGYVAAGADGLRQGLANLLGFPVDAINASPMLLNLLPGVDGVGPMTEDPFGGSRSIDRGLRLGTPVSEPLVPDYVPDGAGERIVNRIGEEVGAAAVPVGAAINTAGRIGVQGARNMQANGNILSRLFGQMTESAAVNPARFTGREAAYAAGAGTGAGIAREAVTDDDPNTQTTAEVVADLIGALGGAGAVALTEGAGRAVADVTTAATGVGANRRVAEAVADELARAANVPATPSGAPDTSALADIVEAGARSIGQTVPGLRPTVADAAADPGLASLEFGRQSGPNAGLYNDRRIQNARVAGEAIEGFRPGGDAASFRTTLDTAAQGQIDEAQLRLYLAETEFDDAMTALQAVQSGEARGQTIRGALETALERARDVEREAWSSVSGQADAAPLAQVFDGITNGLTQSERRIVSDMSAALGTPSTLASGQGPVRLEEITSLRSELTSAIRAASAAGDSNKARLLGRYVDAMDVYLGTAPDIAEPLANARAVSLDLNNRFTRRGTAVADTLATRPTGGPAVPDSEVARRFVRPDEGQASEMDRLLTEVGDQPGVVSGQLASDGTPVTAAQAAALAGDNAEAVRGALRDQILADVNARNMLQNPDRLDAYLSQYEQVFQRFPELRDELGTAAGLRRTATEAAEAARTTEGQLAPGARTPVGQYRRFGPEDALNSARTVVNSDDPARAVRELLETAGNDPDSVENLRSAVWGVLEDRARPTTQTNRLPGGEDQWQFTRLVRALDDPKMGSALRELYADQPEHLDNLRALAATLRDTDLRVTARAPGSSGTPQALQGSQVLPSTETLGAYTFAYQRGQVGLPFIGLRLASTMARRATLAGRGRQFQQLLDEALLNPELASMLLRENNPANAAALSRAARSQLGIRAAWLDDLLMSTEDEPSLEDTVMGD